MIGFRDHAPPQNFRAGPLSMGLGAGFVDPAAPDTATLPLDELREARANREPAHPHAHLVPTPCKNKNHAHLSSPHLGKAKGSIK